MSDEKYVTQIKTGEVCVVREYLQDGSTDGYLFGVFRTEEDARLAYGEPTGVHVPHFDMMPLWISHASRWPAAPQETPEND